MFNIIKKKISNLYKKNINKKIFSFAWTTKIVHRTPWHVVCWILVWPTGGLPDFLRQTCADKWQIGRCHDRIFGNYIWQHNRRLRIERLNLTRWLIIITWICTVQCWKLLHSNSLFNFFLFFFSPTAPSPSLPRPFNLQKLFMPWRRFSWQDIHIHASLACYCLRTIICFVWLR